MSNVWMNAVTDRSQADVDRLLEIFAKGNMDNLNYREQWTLLTDSKGALNKSDLVRIKNNIELLSEVLELNLVTSPVPLIPGVSFYAEIIRNVTAIRNCHYIYTTTPAVPEAPLNTYQKWNAIEKILDDTYDILMSNFHYYAGEQLYAGDSVALLL